MFLKNLKKFIPKSLFGRFFLIITIPTIIVQAVSIYLFFYIYVDVISKHTARSVVSEMVFIKKTVNDEYNKELLRNFAEDIGINFYFEEKIGRKKAKIADSKWKRNRIYHYVNLFPIIDPLNRFKSELVNNGLSQYEIYVDKADDDFLIVKVQTNNGVISFEIPTKRINSSSKYVFIIWMLFAAFITSIVAIIFLKNQLRPISLLNKAAEKLGRGQDVPNFRPSGSREIRSVAISFIKMKERIIRQISQRTDMLSAVSHDLRTPLTRMKLQLEMLENNQEIEGLKQDISDMEKLVDEYLDFARFEEREKRAIISINNFLQEKIINYYHKNNKNLQSDIKIDKDFEMSIKKIALRRALVNIIDNGFNYAQNVEISAYVSQNNLVISIQDDGPGIPETERNNVFKPFYRIDNSRNLSKEDTVAKRSNMGSGLGLAIAMDAVTSHGGRIRLSDSDMGGLKVSIYLPI